MKRIFFNLLKRMGIYYFFKYYPPFFKLRLNVLNPSLAKLIKSENQLFNKVLPAVKLNCVFDGGANVGHLTSYFEKKFKKVIAIEPVPENVAELKGRFKRNENIVIVERIIDNEEAIKTLFISADKDHTVSTVNKKWGDWWQKEHTSQIIQYNNTVEVRTITLPQLIETYGVPDFLKLDIEGNEWTAISLLSHPVPMLSFETHLPGFLDETLKILEHLGRLSNQLLLNASVDDKDLFFPRFIGLNEFIEWLIISKPGYAQVFCKLQ